MFKIITYTACVGLVVALGLLILLSLTPFGLSPIHHTFGEKILVTQGTLTDIRLVGDFGTSHHFTPYIDQERLSDRFIFNHLYDPLAIVQNPKGQTVYNVTGNGIVITIGDYYYVYGSTLPMGEKCYVLSLVPLTQGQTKPMTIKELKALTNG